MSAGVKEAGGKECRRKVALKGEERLSDSEGEVG